MVGKQLSAPAAFRDKQNMQSYVFGPNLAIGVLRIGKFQIGMNSNRLGGADFKPGWGCKANTLHGPLAAPPWCIGGHPKVQGKPVTA